MTGWAGGYVADIEYQPGFYRDQTPSHLDLICQLEGVHAPRETGKPFRYCELGCGLGETAIVIAACHPEAEVVGYDFNPAHIDYARGLARSAGLTNIRFEEKSFAEIAAQPATEGAEFDYIVLHGIWTWVARERQLEILEILNTRLRPGGLAYVTYNSLPSWSENVAFQRLLLDLAATVPGRSDQRLHEALDVLVDIQAAGAPILKKAQLDAVLEKRQHDSAYLAHEYLNENSRPIYHADLAKDLADAKLAFVASAIPLDNFPEIIFDAAQRAVLDRLPAHLRITVGDYFYPHLFRRDVFIRGPRHMGRGPHARSLLDRPLVLAVDAADIEFTTKTAQNFARFDSPFYPFAVRELDQARLSLRELLARFDGAKAPEAREILAFGLQTSQILIATADVDHARMVSINRALVLSALDNGRPNAQIAVAAIGSAVNLNIPAMLTFLALTEGIDDADGISAFAADFLRQSGATLRRSASTPPAVGEMGKELPEKTPAPTSFATQVQEILRKDLPAWRRLGAI